MQALVITWVLVASLLASLVASKRVRRLQSWQLELSGSWDIVKSIEDDRVSLISTGLNEDEMYQIYKLRLKTNLVPHFTEALQKRVEEILDPVHRTRERVMDLSNGEQYVDFKLEGPGWFAHAGVLRPSMLTVATEGKSYRELTTKVLQKAMRVVKRRLGGNWTTITEDGVFHIGAHSKGGLNCELPPNHYHLMSPSPITEEQIEQIKRILQKWHEKML